MRVTDAAQAVQRSGFPEAYAKHEGRAVAIVAASSTGGGGGGVEQAAVTAESSGCTPVSVPVSATTSGTVRAALAQVGRPYEWGATGPDSFDCSGLIVWAWERTGWRLTVRTSQAMHGVAVPVRVGQERPGDLIFGQFGEGGTGARDDGGPAWPRRRGATYRPRRAHPEVQRGGGGADVRSAPGIRHEADHRPRLSTPPGAAPQDGPRQVGLFHAELIHPAEHRGPCRRPPLPVPREGVGQALAQPRP
ncbi:C40 family peptidase [Streptomyces sp. NA13]|uniref:C40 family peptidase n=1 Tax=Streptomyces sp. NA13 TaxID=2996051 RepID=UPI00226FB81D|nr:NlpC/P60 family protein [Streptomyces sp. NA13]WAD00581.1 NlpC/P60 family protein [Streptomyces sp. NA13]